MDHAADFITAIASSGLVPPTSIKGDGKIHRFSSNGKKTDSAGWYIFFDDDRPAGRFGCNRSGIDATWSAQVKREFTEEERAEWRRKMQEREAQRDAEIAVEREQCAREAADMWQRAKPANGHEYLKRKQIEGIGARELDGELLIPLRHGPGRLVGLQRIQADGDKRFLKGSPAGGAYHVIGTPGENVIICEGYATGVSIHQATGHCVVVAFNAGNLQPVAEKIRKALPNASITIAADDDAFTDGNPGVTYAVKAGEAIKARVVIPVWSGERERGTDFNDLHAAEGLDAVREIFSAKPKATHQRHKKNVPVVQSPTPAQTPDAPPPAEFVGGVDWMAILESNKSGFLNNLDNVVRVIERDPDLAGKIWYDEFLDAIVTTWQGRERTWRDSDDVLLQLYLQRHIGLTRIGVNTCHDAALVAAFRNVRNECRDYLTSHKWDGVDRLAYLMTEAFGADDNAYTRAVGRCWFVSMVARVLRPGCKVDTVPVLEGSQGAGKSTALSIIGGKWFVECHESVLTKDFYGVLDGHMLVEISEMHSFTRAEVERVKGIISCQVDKYRKAYGRNTEPHPRKTVLACTTNRDDWQRDDTGARRFWPVLCGVIDHDWLRRNRDQLFAEAVHLLNSGGSWWDVPEDDQRAEVEKRRDVDVWESTIEEWLIGRFNTTTTKIMIDCLKIDVSKHDQMAQKRIGRVMRSLEWEQRVTRDGSRILRVWHRKS